MYKYEEILNDLSERVSELEPGAQIPTEKELALEYGASAMTVRRALQIMTQGGRLRGVPGRGTFVANSRVTKIMGGTASFTEAMRAAGRFPSTRLVEATMRAATEEETSWFDLPRRSHVYVLRRVRCGDGTPLGYEVATLDASRFPGLLATNLEASLYETLATDFDIDIVRTGFVVSARAPRPDESEHLEIDMAAPCLQTIVTSADGSGRPIERTLSLFRGDMYEVRL